MEVLTDGKQLTAYLFLPISIAQGYMQGILGDFNGDVNNDIVDRFGARISLATATASQIHASRQTCM